MIIIITIILVLAIIARTGYGSYFSEMTFKKYIIVSSSFSICLFINRALQPDFNNFKCAVSIVSSVILLLFFAGIAYLFFNKICSVRKNVRYFYCSAYLLLLLGISSQYPFSFISDFFKIQNYMEGERALVDYYKPTADIFGIKKLNIKIIKEEFLGASVIPKGEEANIILTEGLKNLLNKEELKFVMAHEFSHYYLGHYNIRILISLAVIIIFFLITGIIIKIFSDKKETSEFKLFLKIIPFMLIVLILLSTGPILLCRKQEIEADLYAVKVTKDINSAITTFEKSKEKTFLDDRNDIFSFFELHPTIDDRMKEIRNFKIP